MERDRALRDVDEIKQVMHESRKRFGHGKYWIGPALALLAILISGLVPPLAPVIAIGLLVGGVIAWRRSDESIMKAIAAGIIAVGIVLLLATLFVILGLVALHVSSVSSTTTITPVP